MTQILLVYLIELFDQLGEDKPKDEEILNFLRSEVLEFCEVTNM